MNICKGKLQGKYGMEEGQRETEEFCTYVKLRKALLNLYDWLSGERSCDSGQMSRFLSITGCQFCSVNFSLLGNVNCALLPQRQGDLLQVKVKQEQL